MSALKKLAGQTAIYGLSSILGRFLNVILTPMHTSALAQDAYGQNNDIYSIIAFLMVILTFGMETAYFRYFREAKEAREKSATFNHSLFPVISISTVFVILLFLFLSPIAGFLKYADHPEYIAFMGAIVFIDAIAAVPFARLRAENKAYTFVGIRLTQIIGFVLLNTFFFMLCPWMLENEITPDFINKVYNPELGVAYIFISNLIANVIMLLFLLPQILKFRFKISWKREKVYILYALPLVIAGLAGISNEMIDRQFIKYLLPPEISFARLGVYGANYKIATLMMMFIQAFRFAAEPFFFSQSTALDKREIYAKVLKFFSLFQVLMFVGLVGFIDIVKIFIDEKFWEGLYLAPILLFANLLIGVNLNLNFWYKITDQTKYGAYITFVGFGLTIAANLILIPIYGILGAAIATIISYAGMTSYSYYLNQKHFRTPYESGKILFYLLSAFLLGWVLFAFMREEYIWNSLIFISYGALLVFIDRKEFKKLLKLKNT